MIDNVPESYEWLFASLIEAEVRAAEFWSENRETKIEESRYHLGKWVVFATVPAEEA